MRIQIAKWIEHVAALYETGLTGDDLLTKAIAVMRDDGADDKQIADLHQTLYDAWFRAAEQSPTGLLPQADILYAAELATRDKVDEEMVRNAAIALSGASCKAKSTLVEIDIAGQKQIIGWDQVKFVEEANWQKANATIPELRG